MRKHLNKWKYSLPIIVQIVVTFALTRSLPTAYGPPMNRWDWVAVAGGMAANIALAWPLVWRPALARRREFERRRLELLVEKIVDRIIDERGGSRP